MNDEHEQILAQWSDFDNESSDLIVEMNDRGLILCRICVFCEGVLVGVVIIDGGFVVPSGDDIDVVVCRQPLGG